MHDERPFWRSASVLSGLVALVVLVAADAVLRHTSGSAASFTLFLGRFHPLAVHLPIGIVLLVGAAEAATLSPRLRPRIEPAVALALPLLVAAGAGTFLLGHLLARSGDFAPGPLSVHRRLELFAVVGVCLLPLGWAFQARSAWSGARGVYRALLAATLGVLSLGAHFGGTLTRGDTYLSRYAPGPLKGLLGGAPPAPSASATQPKSSEPHLFSDVIQPIFTDRCVSCHGSEKVKGGLRLDSLDAIKKGGEDGAVITPGNAADSMLMQRVLLPKDDDDHMPPEDKPGLTPAEIALIRFWIERGANDTLRVRDLLAPADARSILESSLTGGKTPTATAPSAPAPTPAPAPPAPSPSPSSAPASPAPAPTAPPAAPAPRPASPAPDTAAVPSTAPTAAAAPAPATSSASSASAVLADKCTKCHGPAKQKAKLRVDSLDALLAGGKSGPAIVPGNPSASRVMERLRLPPSDDKHMPPAKEAQLSPHELTLVSSWIQSLSAQASSKTRTPTAPPSSPESPSPPTAHGGAPASSAPSSPTPAPSSAPVDPTSAPAPSAPSPAAAAPATPAPPDLLASLPSHLALYPAEIAPLLRHHCAACHAGKSPAGGLAINDYQALLKGGDTGPAVTPRKPEASLLVQRISAPASDDDHMPPEGAPQLTPNQIALVSAWVERDGTPDGDTPLSSLPEPAVRAIAANPPPRSGGDVARAAPRSGGCGACTVAGERPSDLAGLTGGAAIFALFARRRRARRRISGFFSR